METGKIISFFLPKEVRHNKNHPRYYELYTVVACILMGTAAVCLFPLLLICYHFGEHLWLYYLNAFCHLMTLTAVRYTGHYRLFNLIAATTTYFILYVWLKDSGLIYSLNICIIHMFLLGGILADRKFGWLTIFTNILFLIFIFWKTTTVKTDHLLYDALGSPLYALLLHGLITTFLGSFLAYSLNANEKSRIEIIGLRDQKINLLDEAVRQRTAQLNSMRQTIAADFHDQTGNMLAAINRQAAILQIKYGQDPKALALIESIIANSNGLYASSKDFLWNLNNESDNPLTLFHYLSSYGQSFYNQFDIGFSAEWSGAQPELQQLDPFAALNLIYIFKEAMSNIVKHSGANEVLMKMAYAEGTVIYAIIDNGKWKKADEEVPHYGLKNIERRSVQCGFGYNLTSSEAGTTVTISLPLHLGHIKIQE